MRYEQKGKSRYRVEEGGKGCMKFFPRGKLVCHEIVNEVEGNHRR